MPWMHFGPLGREKFHGLTRERNAPPPTLAENGQTQTQCPQTWSIGFFNPTAAYQLWKIWNDGSSAPDFSAATTAEGSVVVKLLFSQADPSQMPYLKGSPSLKANTTKQTGAPTDCVKLNVMDRTPTTVRLVQVDFAVKDPTHAPKTNWVFGTFAYRNEAPGADPWKKLVPVGVTWGNDPDLSDDMPPNPRESIVLNKFGFTRVFGRNGRMNGPLDNVTASCMACHQTAQKPNTAGLAPADNDKWDVAKCWFRDLSTEAFGNKPSATSCGDTTGFQSLDFSLQLQVGWRNWTNPDAHKKMTASKTMATPKGAAVKSMQPMTIDNKVSLPITR